MENEMNNTAKSKLHGIENLPEEATQKGADSEQQVNRAMERYSNPMMPVLFNRKERALVQDQLVAELAQGFEHRRKAIGMALETRLHSIREACNHVLVTGKTHLRQQRLEYFGQVLRQVEQRMSELADDFLRETDGRFEKLDQFKSEEIRKRERKRLEKSVDDFLGTLDRLMGEFSNIINEHIDHNRSQV
jgi:hypothetical protein